MHHQQTVQLGNLGSVTIEAIDNNITIKLSNQQNDILLNKTVQLMELADNYYETASSIIGRIDESNLSRKLSKHAYVNAMPIQDLISKHFSNVVINPQCIKPLPQLLFEDVKIASFNMNIPIPDYVACTLRDMIPKGKSKVLLKSVMPDGVYLVFDDSSETPALTCVTLN